MKKTILLILITMSCNFYIAAHDNDSITKDVLITILVYCPTTQDSTDYNEKIKPYLETIPLDSINSLLTKYRFGKNEDKSILILIMIFVVLILVVLITLAIILFYKIIKPIQEQKKHCNDETKCTSNNSENNNLNEACKNVGKDTVQESNVKQNSNNKTENVNSRDNTNNHSKESANKGISCIKKTEKNNSITNTNNTSKGKSTNDEKGNHNASSPTNIVYLTPLKEDGRLFKLQERDSKKFCYYAEINNNDIKLHIDILNHNDSQIAEFEHLFTDSICKKEGESIFSAKELEQIMPGIIIKEGDYYKITKKITLKFK